ncbi:MAG: TetR/AcrR family transcriptional regulator [Pseudomonadales bacterium]
MPTREEAKEIRRNRILSAARDLIRETEKTRFSMRMLAERSGVSLVTPYNLFGSKQAIMGALLDEDIDLYGRNLARSRKDPLDRIFHAVTLGTRYFGQDEGYYRAVLSAVYADGGNEYRSKFSGPRLALWRSLVNGAIDAGYLRQDTDTRVLAYHLSSLFYSNILPWAAGQISVRELEQRTLYGFALALYATVRPAHQGRPREVIANTQALLVDLREASRSGREAPQKPKTRRSKKARGTAKDLANGSASGL